MSESGEKNTTRDLTIHIPTESERKIGKAAGVVAGVSIVAGFIKFALATDFIKFIRDAEHGNLIGSAFYATAAGSAAVYSFLKINTKSRTHDNEHQLRQQNDMLSSHRISDKFKRSAAATVFVASLGAAAVQETGIMGGESGSSSETTKTDTQDTGNVTSGTEVGSGAEAEAERTSFEQKLLPLFSFGECEIITPIAANDVDSIGRLQLGLNAAGYPNELTGYQLDGDTNPALDAFKEDYGYSGKRFNDEMCGTLDNLVNGELSDGISDTPTGITNLDIYQLQD